MEAIVEIIRNVTRGSMGDGEDLLDPNPVVDILEVSQGVTVFQEGVDWQQSGNYVDWIGSGSEPTIGTTYTVRWTYTKQMVKGEDYVDGGWFGQTDHPAPGQYFYLVTAYNSSGETAFEAGAVVGRDTTAGEMNRLSWLPVSDATGYRVLKYKDAQYQMNNELQNRDAQTKKGIYSDDFSNTAQSDIYHADWDARVNGIGKFVAPDRTVSSSLLAVDQAGSNASFFGSLALLPGTETVLIEQSDWSEERNINPYAVFEKPPAMLQVTPNLVRRGQTGINFTLSKSGIGLRCDGQIMASNLISDDAGRVSASFAIPTNARNGNRIVEMSDGVYKAQAGLLINDPMVITRIDRSLSLLEFLEAGILR